MLGRLSWGEIAIIIILVVILFGHNKIPTMMKNLANGVKIFKKELKSEPQKKSPAKKPVTKKNKTEK